MLTLLGLSMSSGQPHAVRGTMVDLETGEIVMIFPEKIQTKSLKVGALDVWGKDENSNTGTTYSTGSDFSNLKIFGGLTEQSKKESISCSSNGSCDGGVSLEKSTNNNY